MTIWVKFQERWRGCLDHFLRIGTEWPFRDRKSQLIVMLDGFSAITREPLKVCRPVKHCKKGFREIFQIGLTASYVCTWKFCENPIFALFLAFFGKFLMIFKKISCHSFSFFARTAPVLECFQGLYQVTYHCFRVGEKQCCGNKANWGK